MDITVRVFLNKAYIPPEALHRLTIHSRTIDRIVNDIADGRPSGLQDKLTGKQNPA